MIRDKSTTKPRKRKRYNPLILEILIKRYGFSEDYIRKCLLELRTGILPDKIISEYKTLEKASTDAIEKKVKQLKH